MVFQLGDFVTILDHSIVHQVKHVLLQSGTLLSIGMMIPSNKKPDSKDYDRVFVYAGKKTRVIYELILKNIKVTLASHKQVFLWLIILKSNNRFVPDLTLWAIQKLARINDNLLFR